MDGLASNLRGEVGHDNEMSNQNDSIDLLHLNSDISNNTPGKNNKSKMVDESNLNRTHKV